MPNPIPNPVAADSTGEPDSQWITDVRDALDDFPTPANDTWTADGVGGVFGAGSAPFTLSKGKVYDGSPTSTWVSVNDSTAPQAYTVITSGTPTGTQVLLNYDSRTLVFPSAPTTGHAMQFGYYVVKWRDYSISTALYAGLRQMFPSVGRVYQDTSIQVAVDTWDYPLPSWAQSPDAQISMVEVQDPYTTVEPWRELHPWRRNGTEQLHVPQAGRYSPAARLRVTGWGPFLTLADLPPDLYHLPIWYALSVLLPKKEAKRIREDTSVPLTQEGGQAPGLQVQTGD